MAVPLSLPRSGGSIPSADLANFRAAARKTTVARTALGLALVGTLVAAVMVANDLPTRESGLLAHGRTNLLVLDFSRSVDAEPNARVVANIFRRLARSNEPVGVVAFSDTAYELLPPGSPGKELKGMERFFSQPPGGGAVFDTNPWTGSFSAGTAISTGLRMANDMLERERVKDGTIVLVSDLDTSPGDEPLLAAVLAEFERKGVNLRIVALSPVREDRVYFERVVGKEAFVGARAFGRGGGVTGAARLTGSIPATLLALAALVVLLLVANERWCGRLQLAGARA